MKAVMTVVFAAAVLLVLVAVAFLVAILQSQSNGLEIAAGVMAVAAALGALAGSWSVYRRVGRRVG